MKAVVWQGPRKVVVSEVPDPRVEFPTDAVIRVTGTGICGSDLHLYDHGATMAMKPGDVLGHEAMGVVEEVGKEVRHIRPGDTVVVPFNISCGHCYMCDMQLYSQCETTQNLGGRKGGSLFGYTHLYGGVAGGQAEYLRVPQAHFGPIKVDPAIPANASLLLSDVLPTAWQAVEYAAVPKGGSVVVYGLGPVGQMCCRIALHLGAGRVIGIDRVPDRLATAAVHGAETIDYSKAGDVVQAVREITAGRGADSAIDAVGMDADGSFADRLFQTLKIQPDRMAALHQALGSVRRGGTVSVVGVYAAWMPNFPVGDLFDKQITLRWGQANVRAWTDRLIDVLRDNDPLRAADLVTTEMPLSEAPEAYEHFRDKAPGYQKIVLHP
ncbi:zinc-dependent alcohol dehydrogenase [Bailinhaonella thermotolerans]|uniref:Glutathione-dependent formaldehyde dehydrogenase n=1 Tax=Bailinhaonella thermotolerans TaxID=1070861 RepID=A0A3A4AGG4_9ACTN|nr:zinc-dependent alcohol dehydrogenase [Bailinhaonella thermotolerans]RJL24763.1 glutathione-dependent formaldehyde dehydrogenase [Bailinhaonella thermotolerans]